TRLLYVAQRISSNFKWMKEDKSEKYIRDKVAEVFSAFESLGSLTPARGMLWDFNMQQHIAKFHKERFKQQFDAGDRYSPQYFSTDGLCLLSICEICFRAAVQSVKDLPKEDRTIDFVKS